MAEIIPFRGILYNVSKVSIEDVLAPPYDIITPGYQEELYRKSPYNIVRIDFGKEQPGDNQKENKYTRARKYLKEWISNGVLAESERPSFYAYEMSYSIDGEEKRLNGFLGLVKLEELGKGKIYPHECTHSKPKQDRLNLLRTCKANTSPIFSLYKSSDKRVSTLLSRITRTRPCVEAVDPVGAIHRLWQIDGRKDTGIIKKELGDKDIFIADGHHRYETALEFQKEMNSELRTQNSNLNPWDYVLMFLANMLDEGLTILPTHRLVKEIPEDINIRIRLSEYFEIEPVKADFDIAKRMSGRRCVFGFFQNRNEMWYLLKYKGGNLSEVHPALREIDVIILHDLILKKILKVVDIGYEMDINKALDKVRSGEFCAALFLNPTKVEDVERAALSSVRMPPKSTYFYPKPLTGIVINSFFDSC
ncbi:MAG: DUF1015 domain-containing protein [Thermodesulfovibrionales bacterium]|nr:DUF1015 domain-containing protein [Thermodesulfovibrionales bacterium]